MDHLLKCECGQTHVVSRSQAGQEINCECGATIRVPTLRGIAKLPPAQPAESVLAVEKSSIWQGWRGPAIALASAGFLIAVAFCGWFTTQRLGIDTSYTAESEIAGGDELLETYDPEDLSLVWDNFEKAGMVTKDRPEFYWWNKYADERATLAKISGAIAAGFGVLAIGIWLSARSPKK
jgi:hypothetical protein